MRRTLLLCFSLLFIVPAAGAQTLKVMTAGAMRPVVVAMAPGFQSRTGVEVQVLTDTAGGLARRVQAGEVFDVIVVTTGVLESLAAAGKIDAATRVEMGRVGIGIAVKTGAPVPAFSTVDEFKAMITGARKLAYVDPASGASSGIYLQGLFKRLQLEDTVAPKAVLVKGGQAAERVATGEADIALQQASELFSVEGVTVAGLLPADIQHYTTYGHALAAGSRLRDAAEVFALTLTRPPALAVMRMVGIQPLP